MGRRTDSMYARVHSVIVSELDLPGVKLLTPTLHQDHRGHFVELFTAAELEAAGIPSRFAQANVSHSLPRVLRGLHYQEDPSQGKLVSCIVGTIFDVVVDIDPESATFCQYVAVELDGTSRQSLWIPPRYAHGFFVMGSLRIIVNFTIDNHIETFDRFFDINQHSLKTGKLFCNVERLRKETLNAACTVYNLSVFL